MPQFKDVRTRSCVIQEKEKMNVLAQEEREISPYLFILFRSLKDWIMTDYIWEEGFFSSHSTDSNANFFPKHSDRHNQKYYLTGYLSSLSPVRLAHKINITHYE